MDFTKEANLKGNITEYQDYIQSLEREQDSSLNYLKDPDTSWHIARPLKIKVDEHGHLKPFFGDTLTIAVDENDMPRFRDAVRFLHDEAGEFLAEPLRLEHFHMTLHDLFSSPDPDEAAKKMPENMDKCEEIFTKTAEYFRANPDQAVIEMVTTHPYPCCNISAVMGLAPSSDRDYRILMNLYNLFDDVVYLDYWLRPHVTLAYFKPVDYSKEQMVKLYAKLMKIDEIKFKVTLDLRNTAYQNFMDMNDYRTLMTIKQY